MQLGAGGGDGLNDSLLTCHEVGAHPGHQPRPAAPEQPNPVEAEVHRGTTADVGERRRHRRLLPASQHCVGNMRNVLSVGVRTQARHPRLLEPIPQRADRPLGPPVEEQADGQCHSDGSAAQVDRVVGGLLNPRRRELQQFRAQRDQSARRRNLLTDHRLAGVFGVAVGVPERGHGLAIAQLCAHRRVRVSVVLVERDIHMPVGVQFPVIHRNHLPSTSVRPG